MTIFRFQIEPSALVLFQAIVESYEGLCTVSTADIKTGELLVYTPQTLASSTKQLISDLFQELNLERKGE